MLRYLRGIDWALIAAVVVTIVVQVYLDLKIPDFMADMTRAVETPGSGMSEIWTAGGWMLAAALGSLVAAIAMVAFASIVAANFAKTLREKQYAQVQKFSLAEINRFSTASLITRSANDITQIQIFLVMGLQILIKAPITAVWALTKIANKGTEWSIATAVAVSILITVLVIVFAYAVPRFKRIQALTDNINRITRENLTGIRVVRAYNAEAYQEAKFDVASDELAHTNIEAFRAMAVVFPTMMVIMNGLTLAIYWIGALLIDAAALTQKVTIFADMVVFMNYAMQVVMSFMMLSMIFVLLPRASVSARRVNEVIETEPTLLDGTVTESPTGVRGQLEFRDVSFQYPDASEPALCSISFKAEPGETVAFIGATGSGKTTLINLAMRLYDVTEGAVLVDGVDVRDYRLDALHAKFGYVPQTAVMFSGSVRSNVEFGDAPASAGDDALSRAVEMAQAADFVDKLPERYDDRVAQGGTNLSGGQKQRLSIARAIRRTPEFYVFDDSFSALDYRTDRELRSALKRETADVTTLVVAQRIGTILEADRIVVIDEGRIVGIGSHEELLAENPVYQEIALSQLSQEELAS